MADSAKLTLSSTATLNDGRKIPLLGNYRLFQSRGTVIIIKIILGLGVYQSPRGVATQNAVTWALEVIKSWLFSKFNFLKKILLGWI
jgi:hypothetical protein